MVALAQMRNRRLRSWIEADPGGQFVPETGASALRQEETWGSLQEHDLQPPVLSGENDPFATLPIYTRRCRPPRPRDFVLPWYGSNGANVPTEEAVRHG